MPMAIFGSSPAAVPLPPETEEQRRLRELKEQLGPALGGRQTAAVARSNAVAGSAGAGAGASTGTNASQPLPPPRVSMPNSKAPTEGHKSGFLGGKLKGAAMSAAMGAAMDAFNPKPVPSGSGVAGMPTASGSLNLMGGTSIEPMGGVGSGVLSSSIGPAAIQQISIMERLKKELAKQFSGGR